MQRHLEALRAQMRQAHDETRHAHSRALAMARQCHRLQRELETLLDGVSLSPEHTGDVHQHLREAANRLQDSEQALSQLAADLTTGE